MLALDKFVIRYLFDKKVFNNSDFRRREWRKLASVIVGRCPKKYGIKDGMVLPQVGPM